MRCGLLILLLSFLVACDHPKTSQPPPPKNDTLVYLNHADTARYVGINTCRQCHADIYNSFIQTGMGQSFAAATKSKSFADFGHSLIYDQYSDFWYKAFWGRNDSLYFREFRLAKGDTVYQRVERCDYIVGSGQHTNSHMQHLNGFINQMPMTFYTQKKEWHLPPGFENGVNTRFTRKIGLECMSCHNAYPDFVLGSENRYSSVPEGINCERCHGAGSVHVQQRSSQERIDTSRFIDHSIVNPSKLSIDLQFDVCQRCHLQGNAVLKEGKSFFDFKPGMKLSDYISIFLPKYANADDEFIMASHADRLKMSRCFVKSLDPAKVKNTLRPYKDAMTCVTCHNPHVSVKQTGSETFNRACLNCHGKKIEMHCSEPKVAHDLPKTAQSPLPSSLNCVSCHMPRSGSTDIPHVTVHDHYIRKPVTKKDKDAIKTFLGLFAINEKSPDALTLAKGYINQYEKFEQKPYYLDSAEKYLSSKNPDDILRNFDALVQLYFLRNDYVKATDLVSQVGRDKLFANRLNKKSYDNQHAWTCYRIGECYNYLNNPTEALYAFQQACRLAPYVPEFMDKMATAYAILGNNKMARQYFEETLKQNPRYVAALTDFGFLHLSEGKPDEAEALYKKALALDPDNEDALMNMAGLYNFKGDRKTAIKILKDLIKKRPGNKRAPQILKSLEGKGLAVK
jgi:tetratricopeptide (TPR) repeat protein